MNESSVVSTGELRIRIRTLISESERLFLKFADTFPMFVKEMKASLEYSALTLSNIGSGSGLDDSLRKLFESTRITIADASTQFQEMNKRDHAFLASLNSGIATLGDLDTIIARIKDDSVEMELISLNAMTVALKSGSAGKAFSVITEELKRLSMKTIQLTDLLTGNGKTLLSTFRRYREEVERMEKQQADLFEGLDTRLRGSFSSLETSVREISSQMSALVSRSGNIEPPVRAIMETVQLQDIVRQSLDHVIMALDEIDAISSDGVDDFIFASRLAELSCAMVRDVRESIAKAASTFKTKALIISDIVEDGEQRRRALLEETFGSNDSGSAAASFKNASETLRSISSQVEIYLKTKDSLASNGGLLTSAVESLDAGFREFGKILNRFKNIDVASRIEVAKQQSLQSMSDTVVEMSGLTDRIGHDVSEAMLATRGFILETKSAIQTYTEVSGDEAALIAQSQMGLSSSHDGLARINDSLKDGAQNFSLFTKDFIALLAASSKDSASFDRLIEELDVAVEKLTAFWKATDAELDRKGVDRSIEGMHSPRFKEVIERFTIYAHKQAAADIGGFLVESGSELGEVTLF
ncbi:MAG: hypothetical protein WCT14_14685 [Treponemataceae bacterium]